MQDTPTEVRVTEIDDFFSCAYRWKLSNDGHIMRRESMPLIKGGGVHAARELAFQSWMGRVEGKKARQWPTYEELLEAGRRDFLYRCGGDSAPYDEETGEYYTYTDAGERVNEGDAIREIAPFVRFDLDHVLPRLAQLDIVACEERWHVPIADKELKREYVLTGKIDLLATEIASGRLALHDLKTGSKIKQEDADQRQQLAGYSFGIQRNYGELPLHALGSPRFLKTKPKNVGRNAVVERITLHEGTEHEEKLWGVYETITTDRNENDIKVFLRRFKYMLAMHESGWHPPAASGFMSECFRCELARRRDDRCPFAGSAGGRI